MFFFEGPHEKLGATITDLAGTKGQLWPVGRKMHRSGIDYTIIVDPSLTFSFSRSSARSTTECGAMPISQGMKQAEFQLYFTKCIFNIIGVLKKLEHLPCSLWLNALLCSWDYRNNVKE